MIDHSINELTDFIKSRIEQGYKWEEVARLTLRDIRLMTFVFSERKTTIDKAFPFLF